MAESPYGNMFSSDIYPKIVIVFGVTSFVFALVNLVMGGTA